MATRCVAACSLGHLVFLVLLIFIVAADEDFQPRKSPKPQVFLSLAPESHEEFANMTASDATPEPVCPASRKYSKEKPFVNIFRRRDDCWTQTDGWTFWCSPGYRCCSNPYDIHTGWYCNEVSACGVESTLECTNPMYVVTYTIPECSELIYIVLYSTFVTSTTTLTSFDNQVSTAFISVAETTEWTTSTTTLVKVVTRTDINTATEMFFITVAAGKAQRRAPTLRARSTPLVSPTRSLSMPSMAEKDQRPLIPEITNPPQLHPRSFFRRQ